jgi:hypothetical protein
MAIQEEHNKMAIIPLVRYKRMVFPFCRVSPYQKDRDTLSGLNIAVNHLTLTVFRRSPCNRGDYRDTSRAGFWVLSHTSRCNNFDLSHDMRRRDADISR